MMRDVYEVLRDAAEVFMGTLSEFMDELLGTEKDSKELFVISEKEMHETPYKPNWKERIPDKRLKMHRQRSTI